eukprot:127893_1
MKFKSGEQFVMNLVREYCPEPTVSSSISLTAYYKKANSMFHQALDFVIQGNDTRSYIELMRYCQLITTLMTHNNYNLKQYEKDKNINKRRLNNAITKLEELKPKLIESYNTEIKREREANNNNNAQPQKPRKTNINERSSNSNHSSSLNTSNKEMKWQKRIEELEKTNQNINRENQLLLKKCENMKQLMDMCFVNKERENECVICFDKSRTHVFVPCGHHCICEDCIPLFNETCPLCKTQCDKIIKVYN